MSFVILKASGNYIYHLTIINSVYVFHMSQ